MANEVEQQQQGLGDQKYRLLVQTPWDQIDWKRLDHSYFDRKKVLWDGVDVGSVKRGIGANDSMDAKAKEDFTKSIKQGRAIGKSLPPRCYSRSDPSLLYYSFVVGLLALKLYALEGYSSNLISD